MAEVVEKGPRGWVKKCARCGCTFKYTLKDVTALGFVYCPACSNVHYHVAWVSR